MLARTLPADPDAHAKDVARRGDENAPRWLQESYEHLLSMVSTSSEQHRAYLIACMPYTKELASEAYVIGRGAVDVGIGIIMAGERAAMCARLAGADIRVRQPLGPAALSSLIHSMYAPDHPIAHLPAMSRRNAWPAELDATPPHFLRAKTRESNTAEPWCHATAWIKEWPLTPVGVNFLAPLLVHTPDVIRTVAVAMGLEPPAGAVERMLTQKINNDPHAPPPAQPRPVRRPPPGPPPRRLVPRGQGPGS